MIKIINKNIIFADEQIIAHQVNCKGVMGSGVAKAIKETYPEAFAEYKKFCNSSSNSKDLLGCVQYVVIPRVKKIIVNLFAQDGYGRDKRYTNYESLEDCFRALSRKSRMPIAIPYGIGCGRGGGDWNNIVYPMIENIFKENDISLYKI